MIKTVLFLLSGKFFFRMKINSKQLATSAVFNQGKYYRNINNLGRIDFSPISPVVKVEPDSEDPFLYIRSLGGMLGSLMRGSDEENEENEFS